MQISFHNLRPLSKVYRPDLFFHNPPRTSPSARRVRGPRTTRKARKSDARPLRGIRRRGAKINANQDVLTDFKPKHLGLLSRRLRSPTLEQKTFRVPLTAACMRASQATDHGHDRQALSRAPGPSPSAHYRAAADGLAVTASGLGPAGPQGDPSGWPQCTSRLLGASSGAASHSFCWGWATGKADGNKAAGV